MSALYDKLSLIHFERKEGATTKKYALTLLRSFIAFFVCMMIFLPVSAFIETVAYPALSEIFPNALPDYNPVFEKEELLALNQKLAFIAALLSAFAVGAIEVRHDNLRLEFIISRTDGFYKIVDGIGLYAGEFFLTDIIAALLTPAIFIPLTLIKLPENTEVTVQITARISDFLENFLLAMPNAVVREIGYLWSFILLFTTLFAARMLGAYLGLKRWRALWLSDVEGG